MSRETVLSLLLAHPGEYLSGAAMSRTLGVSRAAVWKAIEALRQEGYEITSAPNRGYRLESAPDRVREGELSGPLSGRLRRIPASRVLLPDRPERTPHDAFRSSDRHPETAPPVPPERPGRTPHGSGGRQIVAITLFFGK